MPVVHHSRGWLGRHRARRPWLLPTVLVGVLLAGTGIAVAGTMAGSASAGGCPGGGTTITVTIATSASTYPVLDRLAQRWNADRPMRGGSCLAAHVVDEQPSRVASTLSPAWDTSTAQRPDVWVPDSSLWLSVAAEHAGAAAMLPPDPPRLAASPVVLAIRKPLAAALGWPDHTVTWQDVISTFGASGGWRKLGHPAWSGLRIGLADPSSATAGLATVLMLLDPDRSGTASDDELVSALDFTQTIGAVAPNTGVLLATQAATAIPTSSSDDGSGSVVAFPVLESELATFDAQHPDRALVPIYPDTDPVVADYPYTVLSAPWVTPAVADAAAAFLDYLQQDTSRAKLAAGGLRDPRGAVQDTSVLPAGLGFTSKPTVPRTAPGPSVLSQLMAQWAALQRHANVLVAVDTSGSMNLAVPGTGTSRLDLLRDCAITGFGLLAGQSSVGLWSFSTAVGGRGYRELVPLGPVADQVGGVSRKQAMINAIDGLRAGGATPLYDTIDAAYQRMLADWQPNSANIIVVITDGANERARGLSLPQLLDRLASAVRADRPIQVIGIAVGPEADADALEQIAGTTGGRVVVARDPSAAAQSLVLAFAGRLS